LSLFYEGGQLHMGGERRAEGSPAKNLQAVLEEHQGRPCYVYNLSEIQKRFQLLQNSIYDPERLKIHYASKANGNPQILGALKALGAGVDVVSGGEVRLALEAGFEPSDVIFSGVAKSKNEIRLALEQRIFQINVESPQELQRIGEIAREMGVKAPVAFRMNPEVNPVTHPYITTGMSENKFGMTKDFLPDLLQILKAEPALELQGLTMHIGSQILQLEVFEEAITKLHGLYQDLKKQGHPLKTLDIGGGVGIQYGSASNDDDLQSIANYSEIVKKTLADFEDKLLIEPGRILVGRSGVLICQVEYIKESVHKNFAIVNSGMHHLLRPALYQATHRILPTKERSEGSQKMYDVVGPICESSDFLGHDRLFRDLKQGDGLVICDAGAYGFSMASNYNAHDLPVEIVF